MSDMTFLPEPEEWRAVFKFVPNEACPEGRVYAIDTSHPAWRELVLATHAGDGEGMKFHAQRLAEAKACAVSKPRDPA